MKEATILVRRGAPCIALMAALSLGCSGKSVVGLNASTLRGTGGTDAGQDTSDPAGAGGEGPLTCGVPATTNAFIPLVPGARWTYSVRDLQRDVDIEPKTNVVIASLGDSTVKVQNLGDRPAIRWLEDTGAAYRWLRNEYLDSSGTTEDVVSDQYYQPAAPRFDYSRTVPGDSWTAQYDKVVIDVSQCPGWSEDAGEENLALCPDAAVTRTAITETWAVTDNDRVVSVPAGEFTTLCQSRACATEAQCMTGEYCFTRGVGKVWEESAEHEELTEYCFPSSLTE